MIAHDDAHNYAWKHGTKEGRFADQS